VQDIKPREFKGLRQFISFKAKQFLSRVGSGLNLNIDLFFQVSDRVEQIVYFGQI